MGSGAILRIPAERKELAGLREFVAQQARAAGARPDQVDDLVQALDEAATNSIVHGYGDGQGMIEVEITWDAKTLVVYLRDEAPSFDSTSVPPPNLNLPLARRKPGGLGIHLIRNCVDGFEHRALEGGGNELIFTKRLNPPE